MIGDPRKFRICPVCKRRVPTKTVNGRRVFKSHMPVLNPTPGSAFCPGSGRPADPILI